MKRTAFLTAVVVAIALLAASAPAADKVTVTGYLIDRSCGAKPERAATHSRACTEKCAGSGLGVVADGKFSAFDERGNQLGADLLKSAKQSKGVRVVVEGTRDGELLNVTSVKEAPEAAQ